MKEFIPLFSAMVGAVAALAGAWLSELRHARTARRADWAAVQRATLLDLQDAVNETFRHLVLAEYEDWSSDKLLRTLTPIEIRMRILQSRLDNRELADRAQSVTGLAALSQLIELGDLAPKIGDSLYGLLAELGDELRRWR